MFNNIPKILAHKSALHDGNFVVPEYILNKGTDCVNLFNRYCPHRMYPISVPGTHLENILCNFHGFEWDKNGVPINNDRKLGCGTASIGKSGLIFKNFSEPAHPWVNDLANEHNLEFSHVRSGNSTGSWLWMMEIQADLLHIRQGTDAIHPRLSEVTNLSDTIMDQGDGWILQTCSTGWWLFIYPFTFIEWSQGCLAVNYTTPNDIKNEFGFSWNTQFYFDPAILDNCRKTFEELVEDVFLEDVAAIEKQKGKYFPIINAHNSLEDHCVHFGKWVSQNRIK